MTHICVGKLIIIGSDNGLSPDRRQTIIWTNAGLLLIGPLETNFSEILTEILTFSSKKMHLKVSSAKRRPFCLGLNVLTDVATIHRVSTVIYGSLQVKLMGIKRNCRIHRSYVRVYIFEQDCITLYKWLMWNCWSFLIISKHFLNSINGMCSFNPAMAQS